jgi:flagellar biogenesis protein FliO
MTLPLSRIATQAEPTAAAGVDLTGYLVVCLALVAGVVAVGWLFRRLVAGGVRARASRRSLQVIEALPLGGKRSLAVVRCYDRTFVLGMGEKEVGLVAELSDLDRGEWRGDEDGESTPTFRQALDRVLAPEERKAPSQSRLQGIVSALRRGDGVLG